MCVEDAQNAGLLDRSFAAVLSRAERAVTGYQVKGVTDKMSLFQAMQSVRSSTEMIRKIILFICSGIYSRETRDPTS